MPDSPLTRVLTEHYLAVGCWTHGDGYIATCACGVTFWQSQERYVRTAWIAHVIALVAAATEAELARQFTATSAYSTQRQATGHVGEPVKGVRPR